MTAALALIFTGVDVVRGEAAVLRGVDWSVAGPERWAVLGPNGSGKTTMLQLASGYLHPTRGSVDILGQRLGRVDVRQLRERIGVVSAAVARMLVGRVSAQNVVMSARHAALEPWWHTYDAGDQTRAGELLADAGFAAVADRPFAVLSEGERQQVLLARTLMTEPDPLAPPLVLVTHHVEEIPAGFTHLLLLREGKVVAAGPIGDVLRADSLSECFGMSLTLRREAGRWSCRAA